MEPTISDWFWSLIDQAGRDRIRLRALLEKMSREEIIRFDREFKEAASALTDPPFINRMPDLSEDGVQDVTEWVVSQGKSFYFDVWGNPDRVPSRLGPPSKSGSLSGVADNVFWDRFDESITSEE